MQKADVHWIVISDRNPAIFDIPHKTCADDAILSKIVESGREVAISTTAQTLCRIWPEKIDAQSNPNFPLVPSS
jgi:hypothetical protein